MKEIEHTLIDAQGAKYKLKLVEQPNLPKQDVDVIVDSHVATAYRVKKKKFVPPTKLEFEFEHSNISNRHTLKDLENIAENFKRPEDPVAEISAVTTIWESANRAARHSVQVG